MAFQAGNKFGKGRPQVDKTVRELEKTVKKVLDKAIVAASGDITDKIQNMAIISIDMFYADFSPKTYKRHYNNIPKAFRRVNHSIVGGRRCGIIVDPSFVQQIYGDTSTYVFSRVFNRGILGTYSIGHMSTSPKSIINKSFEKYQENEINVDVRRRINQFLKNI